MWLNVECSICKSVGQPSKMIKRCAHRMIGATPFYGCSNYPKCDFTMSTSTFGKYLSEKKRGYEYKRKPTI